MWSRCNHWISRLLWLLLVLSVVYVWSGRFLAKVIPEHRSGIEYWLTQRLSTQVSIGAIQVSGHLLAPNIVLRDIRVMSLDATRPPLTMKLCWVGVDGLASLWHQQLRLRFLQLNGLNVRVWQTEHDEWRVSGFDALQPGQSSGQSPLRRASRMHQTLLWLDSLIAQRGLVLDDINLQVEPSHLSPQFSPQWLKFLYGEVEVDAPLLPQKLWMQRLALHKQDQQYQLFSQLTLLKTNPVSLTLIAHILGQSLSPETWQTRAYLKLDHTDIKPWISAQLPMNITLDALSGQAEAWLTLQSGRLQKMHGRVELDQARWRYQWHSYRVDHWQGAFDWQYDHRQQWSLQLQPTTWHVANQQWTLPSLRFDRQAQANQPASRHVQLADFDLAPLHELINAVAQFDPLVASLVPSVSSLILEHRAPLLKKRSMASWINELHQYSPKGQVRHLSWLQTEAEQSWQLQLTDLALNAHNDWPGFTGLHAQLQGKRAGDKVTRQTHVMVQLDSPQLVFDWPSVFRQALPAVRVKGQAMLIVQPNQWQLQLPNLETLNADAIAHGQASLTQFANEAPLLTLQAQFRHANGKAAGVYLPTKVIAPNIVRWLEMAVLDGDIQQADFLYQGRLHKNRHMQKKYDPLAKSLLMRYQFNNATIDYLPPWPRLEQAQGQVSVDGKNIQVSLQQAKMLDAKILPSQLTIAEINDELRLKLQADAVGDAQTGLAVLAQSPLQESLAGLLTAVNVQGAIKIHLQLDAPLGVAVQKKKSRPLWANVRTQFENVNVDFPVLKLSAQKFNGELTYDTEKGVSIPSWQAVLFDQPLKGRTHTESITNSRAIVSEFSGNMPLKLFNEWLQQPIVTYASGATAYQAQLVLTPWQQMQGAFLQVDTDLKGVKIELPPPFGLDGKQSLNLRYRQQLDPLQPAIDIRYGSWVRFIKQKESMRFAFGEAYNEARGFNLPSGITVSGRLPSIDLQQWMAVFPERKSVLNSHSLSQAGKAQSSSWSDLLLSLHALDLSLNNLRWKDTELGSTKLKVTPRQQDWQVAINSLNLDAEAEVPLALVRHWADHGFAALSRVNADQVLPLRIARLQLPLSTQSGLEPLSIAKPLSIPAPSVVPTPPPISAPPNFIPDAFPAMQLSVAQIIKHGKNLGSLQTQIQSSATGLFFQDIKAHIKQVNLQGRGRWRWQPETSSVTLNSVQLPQTSQFVGQLATDNMLGFLAAWDYPPVIDAKAAQLNVDLTWSGNPTDLAISRLEGNLDVTMNNGRLLKVDTTTASVRVAGIMNFETIIRRMQLDFSDLFKKGLAFDEIKGNFVLANTQMHTDNFVLKGPAATFKVSGNADLLHRQLDQRLTVTLPVSRNLVLPAAATGGLPAAATVFLIEQALGDRLDKLTELNFSMQGSWQDPKIEKR